MLSSTLLIIDDDTVVLDSLKRLFRVEGYEIVTAENAEEGLKQLEKQNIDLIVCDYKMPGKSGLEFLQETLPQYPDVIRILLTGQADLDMAIDAINKGGVYKFMLKPWNNEELVITVKRALEYKELLMKSRDMSEKVREKDIILQALEKQYPGITEKPEDGIYRIPNN